MTLLLVEHGSPGGRSGPAFDHARRLRATGAFADVRVARLNGRPSVTDALAAAEDEIDIVPLLVSEGYVATTVLPDAVETATDDDVTIRYVSPVGTHERLADVILERVESAVGDRREGVALALLGHGSERSAESAHPVRTHATRLRDCGFDAVRAFFIEEQPGIERVRTAFDAQIVVAVPVLMGKGRHVCVDLPESLGFPGAIDPPAVAPDGLRYTAPVGTAPTVTEIAFERAMTVVDSRDAEQDATPTNVTDRSARRRYRP